MNKFLSNKSINKINLFSALFSIVLFIVVIVIIIFNSYTQYQEDIKKIEKDYIVSQKKFVEQETKRALQYIEYRYKTNKNVPLEKLQVEITEVIEHMRNVGNGTGYVFIYTFDGINIADPILKQNSGKNMLDFTDPNGKKVIYELIVESKKKDGGFVEYVWNKPTTNTLEPKISYAKAFTPWKWMVGAGVYLDDIEKILNEKKKEYTVKTTKFILQIIAIVSVMYILGFLVYRYLMLFIKADIEKIRDASENLTLVDVNEISFKEFKKVGHHLNEMTTSLQDLNKNLEEKVSERTSELEKAKEYALNLVAKQDKFIKDAIHEINTPLGIIINNIDLFNLKHGKNKYLSKIEAGAKIIHNIYNDLEYMIKKDRIEYKYMKLNLTEFLETRIDFFEEIAFGNGLQIKKELQKDIEIDFNDILLQRVIDNTLSNAIKYSLDESDIVVKLFSTNDNYVVEVSNSSEDIKNLEKLFKRFYRENDSRGGFGIGLNIIKEICDKNNVEVEITSHNHLTTFRYNFKLV